MSFLPTVESEFASLNLGDERLNRRARFSARAIFDRYHMSFPRIFPDADDLKGFYRLMNNEDIPPASLLAPHQKSSWERASSTPFAVILHDTTEFSFPGETPRDGLEHHKGKSTFHAHLALAVAEGPLPVVYGVVGLRTYTAEDGLWYEHLDDGNQESLLVGSDRWSDVASDVASACPPSSFLIHVMDREADDYELFCHLHAQPRSFFVLRAKHDRLVTEGTLRETVARAEAVVSREVQISRRGNLRPPASLKSHPPRDRRSAKLTIRSREVEIRRPDGVRADLPATFRLSVIEVFEVDPPEGFDPVNWRLLTTLPAETGEQILRVVDIYRKRWLIEEFFKALKTGCAYEERQAESQDSLLRVLSMLLPVAVRLLALRTMSREAPETSAEAVLDEVQIEVLRSMVPARLLPKRPTAREVMRAVAHVGGHSARNREPGWLVLGRGMEMLLQREIGWRAALAWVKSGQLLPSL